MGLGVRIIYEEDGRITIQTDSGIVRPEKGKSLLARLNDFTAVDVETTGLSPMFDSIIELSAVRYRGGMEVAAYDQLVDPEFEIDSFITQLTGITNAMLHSQPLIEQALPEFLAFLGEDVIVGHNVNFDINFIYDACVDLDLPPLRNDFVDTMRVSKRLYKDWPDHKLDTLLDRLRAGSRTQHRAENDARLTAAAYFTMTADPGFDDAMKTVSYNALAKNIVARDGFTNENSPLYGKVCVFTGALESFTRREAMQLVADIGGICGDGVTKKTNFLVLGNNDYCKSIKDGKSGKQKKAEKLILEGADLQIIPESVFLDMLSSE